MSGHLQMRLLAGLVTLATIAGLGFVYAVPPQSLRLDRDGQPHFQPEVLNPETGEGIPMGDLIRHFKGG